MELQTPNRHGLCADGVTWTRSYHTIYVNLDIEMTAAYTTVALRLIDRTHIRFPLENAILLMLSILALTLGSATFYFCSKKRVEEPSTAFEALLSIITPTCVAWPTDYNVLFKASSSRPSMTIRIRVSNFLRNVIAGTIELKDLDDLPYLFRRQLRAYGWLVSLDADFFLRTSVLQWILVSQIPGFITKSNCYPHLPHNADVPGKDICSFCNRCSLVGTPSRKREERLFSRPNYVQRRP